LTQFTNEGLNVGNSFDNTSINNYAELGSITDRVKDTRPFNLEFDSGDVCFGINFLQCLPAGVLNDSLGDLTGLKSGSPHIACEDIEVCCGWYQYNLSNSACALYRRATILVVIQILQKTVTANTPLLNALQQVQQFIEGRYGYYKMSRHKKSNTVQLWLSNLPSVEDKNLPYIGPSLTFNSGFANLVLDGVYKSKCGYGGRRYTGSLVTKQRQIIFIDEDTNPSVAETFQNTLSFAPESGTPPVPNPIHYSLTKRHFGTLSVNVVIPE
jgi:hypothetical protein